MACSSGLASPCSTSCTANRKQRNLKTGTFKFKINKLNQCWRPLRWTTLFFQMCPKLEWVIVSHLHRIQIWKQQIVYLQVQGWVSRRIIYCSNVLMHWLNMQKGNSATDVDEEDFWGPAALRSCSKHILKHFMQRSSASTYASQMHN